MSYLKTRDYLKLQTTPEQDFACLFLEQMGKRFCIDFGYENCVEMAQEFGEFSNPQWVM